MRSALAHAIRSGHGNIALQLSQDINEVEGFHIWKTTALQWACQYRLFRLIRYLLSGPGHLMKEQTVKDRTFALCYMLGKSRTKYDWVFVKRNVHEDVYQITWILLQHKANPDLLITCMGATVRKQAATHPCPRTRGLLLPLRPIYTPQSGRSNY
jgi:hypothetical protein